MDKKLHEDLNRMRKLSGLTEQERTWTERLPDGTIRTHRYNYSDEKQGVGDWDEYKNHRPWNSGSSGAFGPLDGPGKGTGNYGQGTGSGNSGSGQGQVGVGTGYGSGSSVGSGRIGTGTGTGNGTIQRIPGPGTGSYPSTGYGSGAGTYGTSPDVGTYSTSPGYDYSSDDSDTSSRPETKRERAERLRQEKEQAAQDAADAAAAAAEERRQEREYAKSLKQQQQTPPLQTLPSATTSLGKAPAPTPREPVKAEPPKEVPTLPSATTSLGKAPAPTSIAKDLLLKEPPKEVPTLPSATTSLGKVPAPVPRAEPIKVEPPKEVPTLPSATTSLGKLPTPAPVAKVEPPKEPAKVATDLPVFKAPEKPITFPNASVVTPKVISTPEPSTWDIPTPAEKPAEPAKAEPAPPPQPTAAPSDREQPDVKIDAKTDTAPSGSVSVAKDILLPQEPPANTQSQPKPPDEPIPIEVELISPQEFDARTNPQSYNMPRPSNPSKGSPTAGSGSAGAGSDGAAGASGEKGGGSSSKGKPYIPITPKTMSAPVSDKPSWAAQQRVAQGTPLPGDPEKPENISGAQGSIQPPRDANADIIAKGNKATINMTPADAAKAKTNVFKLDSPGPETPSDTSPPDDDAPRELTITPKKDKKPEDDKPAESLDRMRQLAGIKESVKAERQLLQESAANNINRIRSLAGLNK